MLAGLCHKDSDTAAGSEDGRLHRAQRARLLMDLAVDQRRLSLGWPGMDAAHAKWSKGNDDLRTTLRRTAATLLFGNVAVSDLPGAQRDAWIRRSQDISQCVVASIQVTETLREPMECRSCVAAIIRRLSRDRPDSSERGGNAFDWHTEMLEAEAVAIS